MIVYNSTEQYLTNLRIDLILTNYVEEKFLNLEMSVANMATFVTFSRHAF